MEFCLQQCWAKTDPRTGLPVLTVRDHSLIVGAVGLVVLWRLWPACRGLPPEGAVTLIALHDIGKITPGFLRKCARSVFFHIPGLQTCEANHAKVSQAFLASLPEMRGATGQPLHWTLAADGHHGIYSLPGAARTFTGLRPRVVEGPFQWPELLRRELLEEIRGFFGPLPTEVIVTGARLHWLTGLVTFCDWIGSNTDWFPLVVNEPLQDRETLESAREGAEKALDFIGWHRREVRKGLTFPQLFGAPDFVPRPLQKTLIRVTDRPGLYVVEAPMGMGKTEAALAAAYRRWSEGGERGLYFALPTQLTSNRIHERISGFLGNVIADPSIQTLAHGNAWLREDHARAFRSATTEAAPGRDDPTDAGDACRWFASGRKALLAPFGTGTIDQALMARIAAKHSALRLFALSGKVVVIDEVHSYDPYTAKLVDHLTAWLLETGCTVIILSATLTARRRAELVAAAGGTEPPSKRMTYPLITRVAGGKVTRHPVRDPGRGKSTVKLRHVTGDSTEFWQEVADAAEKGACVLVIRNTVAAAQETWRLLKSLVKDADLPLGLIHSRFPYFRRGEQEGEWMRLLGKKDEARPAGCILVATQVVEQSVDIDADLLVTDAAPTDLILQRLGRLHRHPRARPAGFGDPVCWVLHPEVDWQAGAEEIREALGPAAHVYPPFALYQAWRVWAGRRRVRLPGEIRKLLEMSDIVPDDLPQGVADLREALEQDVADMLRTGSRQDPFHQPSLEDKEGARTRWNLQSSALLVLLREEPRRQGHRITLSPIHGDPITLIAGVFSYDLAKALHENAVRVPAYLVKDAFAVQPDWLVQHASECVLAVCGRDSTDLQVIGVDQVQFQLRYSPELGVTHQRVANTVRHHNSEDFDFMF